MINLKSLVISHNYLKSLEGVAECSNLEYLNVAHNYIEDLSALGSLSKLSTLKANNNQIKEIFCLRTCRQLSYIKLCHNRIFNFDNTLNALQTLPQLVKLKINFNPCVMKVKEARQKLIVHLWLEELDGKDIGEQEKEQAQQSFHSSELSVKPRQTASETFTMRPSVSVNEEQLEVQITQLRKDNARLRTELNNVWQLLETILKQREIEESDEEDSDLEVPDEKL